MEKIVEICGKGTSQISKRTFRKLRNMVEKSDYINKVNKEAPICKSTSSVGIFRLVTWVT